MRITVVLYLLVLAFLGVYSYSQIDLNLTLLQAPWFLAFQNTMIQLGYFNRPLSAAIFIVLVLLSSIFYLLFSRAAGQLSNKNMIALLAGITMLGLISYSAFSHDIFNAVFYPRLIFEHGANPYAATALMFPGDTWTRFMHWTHNTYQWGPVYLGLTMPLYLLGFGKFVLTLFWFKALYVGAYLLGAYFVYRISSKKGLILYALNPLIIIEGVVAGHLDIVMLAFALAAVYFREQKKPVLSLTLLVLSAGVKFVTILLVPVLVLWHKLSPAQKQYGLAGLAYAGAFVQIYSRGLLPHYFLVPLGFCALYPHNRILFWSSAILSIFLLLIRYIPFLYTGQW